MIRSMLTSTVLAGAVVLWTPLPAQEARAVSIHASLECFEQSRRKGLNTSQCESGIVPVEAIVLSPGRYSALLDPVLDGLERLALESDDRHVRQAALLKLSIPGWASQESPVRGIVQRLANLYPWLDDPALRDVVVKAMLHQAERHGAIDLLRAVAQDERPEDRDLHWPPALTAIGILREMGTDGTQALRDLHARGVIENAQARIRLQQLAEDGFPPR